MTNPRRTRRTSPYAVSMASARAAPKDSAGSSLTTSWLTMDTSLLPPHQTRKAPCSVPQGRPLPLTLPSLLALHDDETQRKCRCTTASNEMNFVRSLNQGPVTINPGILLDWPLCFSQKLVASVGPQSLQIRQSSKSHRILYCPNCYRQTSHSVSACDHIDYSLHSSYGLNSGNYSTHFI